MGLEIVVIGAGVGGLGAALGLARNGHEVTVLDRDPAPVATDPTDAFATWPRRSVPQFRQAHAFSARTRNLLLENAPDVVDRLLEAGATEWNVLDLAPPEAREASDDQFTGLMVRRAPFEFALRDAVRQEPRIDLRSDTVVDGLQFAEDTGQMPEVTGVVLAGGTRLRADVVIDAGGRRTPVPGWLAQRGVHLPASEEACELTYYGRYLRQRDGSSLDRAQLTLTNPGDLGYLMYVLLDGDNRTFAVILGTGPWDTELKALRHNRVWEAAARAIPAVAPWTDPAEAEPITDVLPMAGHSNILRRFVVDDEPVVLGLLPVGDSLCTTNPAFGWGASLALTYAFSAVEAICRHEKDRRDLVLAYAAAAMPAAEQYYETSAAQDRIRTYRWRGEPIPEHEQQEADRQTLIDTGLQPAMRRDMHVLRAMMRRVALIDPPHAVFEDERAMATAREVAEWRAKNRPPTSLGPTRDEMLEVMGAGPSEPVEA